MKPSDLHSAPQPAEPTMSATLPPNRQPIAVVGVSALFPGSSDATGFWRDILEGRDLIGDVPPSHWLVEDYFDADPAAPDKTYARRGGFLDPVGFDALGFGVPPSTLPATDTSQLLALILAQSVLQDAAREQFDTMDRSRISVILGVTSAQELLFSMVSRLQRPVWVKALREAGLPEDEVQAACERIAGHYVPWQESSFPGLLGNVVAGRIANRLNLGGTNCVTDAACASALSAISMAIGELQLGTSDLVISGGVDTLNDIFMYMCFSKTPALSPSGDCRPFSDQADGTMLGEGLGMVALKRLADAERDGDRIYAVIRGLGTSSDGRAKSVYAPVSEGQAKALRRAYELAGYGPDTVELMEAHGTGTKAGDVAEFEGLRQVFGGADAQRRQWCALGSVKSQIGHTKAAAGAAGLFKAVMALHHKVLPPGIKIEAPNPKLEIERSPFYLNTRTRPWIRGRAHPRRASVSAFGFGGSNFHVTLEEYQGSAPRAERFTTRRQELVVLTADDAGALARRARELAGGKEPLALVAWQSRRDFKPGCAARLALVAGDAMQLQARLLAAAQRIEAAPGTAFALPDGTAYGVGAKQGALAMLFPGQGSQFPDMGADLAVHFPVARAVWDRAADLALDPQVALHEVVFPRPGFGADAAQADAARLTQTQWAQPAIGATSLSMLAVLDECGVRAEMLGGHSFGEMVALHAAGVMGEAELLRIARRRGELMAAASAMPGAMTALSLPVQRVRELIAQANSPVVVANHNAPQQVVVSGEMQAIEEFETALSTQGVAFRRLPVASGFHSRVVAGCCEPFAEFLSGIAFSPAQLPVYGNAEAALHAPEPQALRAALAAQIAQPVRFVEMIEAMYAAGARTFLEVGPGAVLSGLVAAILGERQHQVIPLDRKHKDGVESLLQALARLVAAGIDLRLDALFAAEREPARAPSHGRPLTPINGSNVGKPYPPQGGAPALPPPNPSRPVRAEPVVESPVNPNSNAPAPLPSTPTNAAPVEAAAGASEAWLQTFQHSQEQLAAAHLAFQRSMFESHAAYLQLAESALSGLAQMAGGQGVSPLAPSMAAPTLAPTGAVPATLPISRPIATSTSPMATPTPPTAMPPVGAAAPLSPVATASLPIATAPSPATTPVRPAAVPANFASVPAASPSASGTVDLTALMLQIVAEKTGYPVDMLDLNMDLEGDLGVDSIKRVEILAAVDERAPGLPKLDRGHMSALHTLAEIVDYLRGQQGSAPTPASASSAVAAAAPAAAKPDVDLTALMLQIVAEKTGYPVDMLDLNMDLEGDLGVDSIKRVEILAAVDERAPGLPKLDRSHMSALHTLAEIVDYLRGQQSGAPTPASASSAVAAAAPAAAKPDVDLTALMLQIVAEKTGYPVDMLDLNMDLESDLGVDSIKRVEILAAVDERAPGLPKLDRGHMSALHTLAEIVAYLQGQQVGATVTPTASTALAAAPAPSAALGRYRLERVPAPAAGMAQPGLRGGKEIWIVGEATIGDCLAAELRSRGVDARCADRLPQGASACIYLGGLREVADAAAATAINREAFEQARLLAAKLEKGRGLFVTVQDTGGNFGLTPTDPLRAWSAGLPALVKTAALEWPRASLKAIDLERGSRSPQALANAIADELLEGGGEVEVALPLAGGRHTLRSVAEAATAGLPALAAGDVVVVSGGARGVTAACIVEWAQQCPARFVLLGRTALRDEPAAYAGVVDEAGLKRVVLDQARARAEFPTPADVAARVREIQGNREVRRTLAAIAEAGAQARYEAVDVTDAAALNEMLARVRDQWGPVAGLVHAAGVLADKRIGEKTDAQFKQVFDTKIEGLRALLAATADDPLKLLCVFSSVSARCGNTGQSDYAMANEVLVKVALAESRRRPGLVAKSLGWGPWEAGMVTPALRDRFAALGVPMIPLREGARMFAAEMSGGQREQVELVLGGEPRPEALLFDGSSARVQELEIDVARSSHAYLEGHTIDGQPVLPLVLAAEWLTRAARSFRPGLPQAVLHDIKVLKGIRLGGFENGGDRFTLQATPLPSERGAQMQMLIRDAQGHNNYSARVELLPETETAAPPPAALTLEPWSGQPLYRDLLFHRGPFELIQRLDGISDHGVAATLRGVQHAGWDAERWQLDVAALDAGLQMAVLLGTRMLGGPNLPTGIDQLRSFGSGPGTGLLNATAYRRSLGPSSMTTDIVFTDDGGRCVAELVGVHNHALVRA
jgi:acyl transferase domain-containing protein/acyl carrier protein